MLWPEMDAAFVTSGGGGGEPPATARRPVIIIAAGQFAPSLSWRAPAGAMLISCRPVLVVHVDDVAVAMALGHVPVRVPVRLRPFPALVLVPVMLIVNVEMGVLNRCMLMLEHLQVLAWP